MDEILQFSQKLLHFDNRREVKELRKINDELKFYVTRVINDYESYKRASEIRCLQREREVKERFVREIIPILEDIDRLLSRVKSLNLAEDVNRAINVMVKKMEHGLKNLGIEKVQPSEGDEFDPGTCEALTVISTSTVEKGKIAAVFEPGWKFEGKLIKPARVGVAS